MNSLIPICMTAGRELLSHRRLFFRLLLIPALFFVALDLLVESAMQENPEGWSPLTLVSFPLSLLIFGMFAVATHRIFLLGPQSASSFGSVFVNVRLLRFIGYSILLTMIMTVVLVPFAVLAVPVLAFTGGENGYAFFIAWGFGMVIAGYLVARLAFVLPSIAMDQPISLGDAWEISSRCRIRAFVIVIALPLVLGVPGMLTAGGPLLLTAIGSCVSLVAVIYGISCFSVLFREIMSRPEDDDNVTTPGGGRP